VLVLTSLLSYYYYLRVIWKMYFEEAPSETAVPAPTRTFGLAGAVAVLGLLAAGLLPARMVDATGAAGREIAAETPRTAPEPAPPAATDDLVEPRAE
jgi:NADH:ubiquinone oxidoreductase subunit 2 (subunit N)